MESHLPGPLGYQLSSEQGTDPAALSLLPGARGGLGNSETGWRHTVAESWGHAWAQRPPPEWMAALAAPGLRQCQAVGRFGAEEGVRLSETLYCGGSGTSSPPSCRMLEGSPSMPVCRQERKTETR